MLKDEGEPADPQTRPLHPLPLRIMHWTNAVAMIIMIAQRLADLQRRGLVRLAAFSQLDHDRRRSRGCLAVAFLRHVDPGDQRPRLSRVWPARPAAFDACCCRSAPPRCCWRYARHCALISSTTTSRNTTPCSASSISASLPSSSCRFCPASSSGSRSSSPSCRFSSTISRAHDSRISSAWSRSSGSFWCMSRWRSSCPRHWSRC